MKADKKDEYEIKKMVSYMQLICKFSKVYSEFLNNFVYFPNTQQCIDDMIMKKILVHFFCNNKLEPRKKGKYIHVPWFTLLRCIVLVLISL